MSATELNRADARTAVAGDETARLFAEHSRMVLGLCRMLLRDPDEADDATQQTFLAAHKALLTGTTPRDAGAWIATIARNECRARVRKRMAAPAIASFDEEFDAAGGDATADGAARNATVAELRAALAALPERQREAILLRELCGLRHDEVASAMNVAQPTVEVLLWKARRRLGDRASLLPGLAGPMLVPPWVREQLIKLIPGFGGGEALVVGSAAGASVPIAAKIAAVTAGAVVATTGAVGPAQRPAVPAQPAVAAGKLDDDRSGRRGGDGVREDRSGRGRGRGSDDAQDDDRSGRRGGDDATDDGDSSGRGSGGDDVRERDDSSGSDSGSDDRVLAFATDDSSGSGSSGSGRWEDSSGSGSSGSGGSDDSSSSGHGSDD